MIHHGQGLALHFKARQHLLGIHAQFDNLQRNPLLYRCQLILPCQPRRSCPHRSSASACSLRSWCPHLPRWVTRQLRNRARACPRRYSFPDPWRSGPLLALAGSSAFPPQASSKRADNSSKLASSGMALKIFRAVITLHASWSRPATHSLLRFLGEFSPRLGFETEPPHGMVCPWIKLRRKNSFATSIPGNFSGLVKPQWKKRCWMAPGFSACPAKPSELA